MTERKNRVCYNQRTSLLNSILQFGEQGLYTECEKIRYVLLTAMTIVRYEVLDEVRKNRPKRIYYF